MNADAVKNLADRLRALAHSGSPDLASCVEGYLEQELREVPLRERSHLVEELARHFQRPQAQRSMAVPSGDAAALFSRLLGREISDCSSADLTERFAESLNTIFDTLNRIVGVINSTLLGRSSELETIRQVIGAHIEAEEDEASLQGYLEQIQRAFLISHEAFLEAAHSVVSDMLVVLDPERLEAESKGGMKFGPLRKADLYDAYQEKFEQCKGWVGSPLFRQKLLREFESRCQKKFESERGETI